jgi:hypothetical protein
MQEMIVGLTVAILSARGSGENISKDRLAVTCWMVGMFVILCLLALGFVGVRNDTALVIYGIVTVSMPCAFFGEERV